MQGTDKVDILRIHAIKLNTIIYQVLMINLPEGKLAPVFSLSQNFSLSPRNRQWEFSSPASLDKMPVYLGFGLDRFHC